jgi:hypothetical protein
MIKAHPMDRKKRQGELGCAYYPKIRGGIINQLKRKIQKGDNYNTVQLHSVT